MILKLILPLKPQQRMFEKACILNEVTHMVCEKVKSQKLHPKFRSIRVEAVHKNFL